LYLLLLTSFIQFIAISADSYEEDTTITLDEADALQKFQGLVAKIKLPHEYMEKSIFLVKWLRANNFDVNAAVEKLVKHIEWRAENKIDKIDDEDWQDFQEKFTYTLGGADKEGRPLVQMIIKDWNVTIAMASGQGDRLTRWFYRYMEASTKRVRSLQKEGKKISRFSIIADADGFNPVDHGCPSCMSMYITVAKALDQQFPESLNKLYVVNASQYYRDAINKIWPTLSKRSQKALKVYGTDSDIWKKALSKIIDDDELLPAFGGTMKTE